MTDRTRHPSTLIADEVVQEINFRVYLRRLDPPLTPEQSAASSYTCQDSRGKVVVQNDASRRRNARSYLPLTREYLRAMVDAGLISPAGGVL